jgi:N,N'-diacetyllegionaminate synthase
MKQEIIVELGNVHEGSLGIAKSLVEIVSETGADIVKFQMHLAEFEGFMDEPFRVNFSEQDSTRHEYWNRVGFTSDQWRNISSFSNSNNLEFLCTPFSIEAAKKLLQETSIKRWKVGSGDACNFPLIDFLVSTQLPVIISTGLVSKSEIETLASRLDRHGVLQSTTLMHCVSQYPTPLGKSSLHLINYLKTFGCLVGLSDHSGDYMVGMAGLSMGVNLLEIHLTPHKLFFGPDVSSSLTSDEIRTLVDYRNKLSVINDSSQPDKDTLFHEAESMRYLFRKGIFWGRDLEQGEQVQIEDLLFRKPCKGIDAVDFEKVIGRTVKISVEKNGPVLREQIYE